MMKFTTTQHSSSGHPKRRYDVDALRVGAFGLLILYHVGMFYVAGWDWHIKSYYQSERLQLLMSIVSPWRMPLIFLISGVASHFLLRKKSASKYARSRIKRLLIPLLFGVMVVVPPQAYLQALSNHAFDGSYVGFLWHYFTFQDWPANAFDGSDYGFTWNHLWYLPYLLVYSLILAALMPLLTSARFQSLMDRCHRLRGWQLMLPALPFVIYEWLLNDRFPTTHALYNDWDSHAVYFTVFFYGYVLGSRERLWEELSRLRWWALCLGLIFFAWRLAGAELFGDAVVGAILEGFVIPSLMGWFLLVAAVGWGHHMLNRPFTWLAYATEAVYPWYILHQTITIVAGYHLSKLMMGPVIEPILVLFITISGCFFLHEFVIRRVGILRPLFGLKPTAPAGGVHADLSAVPVLNRNRR